MTYTNTEKLIEALSHLQSSIISNTNDLNKSRFSIKHIQHTIEDTTDRVNKLIELNNCLKV